MDDFFRILKAVLILRALGSEFALVFYSYSQKSFARTFATDYDRFLLFFAGVLARAGKVKESVDLLLKDKKDDIDRILIAAQVLLEKGDVSGSLAILEKLPSSVKHRTGLLSSMVIFFFRKSQKYIVKNFIHFMNFS